MRCLASLAREKRLVPGMAVDVVDGGSGDGSAEALSNAIGQRDYRDWVSFIPLRVNGGFGWANNQAIAWLLMQSAPPEFVHLLNPDTEIQEEAVAL